jgi:hypothetical protein
MNLPDLNLAVIGYLAYAVGLTIVVVLAFARGVRLVLRILHEEWYDEDRR